MVDIFKEMNKPTSTPIVDRGQTLLIYLTGSIRLSEMFVNMVTVSIAGNITIREFHSIRFLLRYYKGDVFAGFSRIRLCTHSELLLSTKMYLLAELR